MVMSVGTLVFLILVVVLGALLLGVTLGVEWAHRQARGKRRAQAQRRRTRQAAARVSSAQQPWNKRPPVVHTGIGPWRDGHDERP